VIHYASTPNAWRRPSPEFTPYGQQGLIRRIAQPAIRAIEYKHLFQNYKQLTFFDTLALYFHLYHASERGEEVYIHVPMTAESDSNITVKKIDNQNYSLDPFPFAGDTLKLSCRGRYARPFSDDFPADRVGAALAEMRADTQSCDISLASF